MIIEDSAHKFISFLSGITRSNLASGFVARSSPPYQSPFNFTLTGSLTRSKPAQAIDHSNIGCESGASAPCVDERILFLFAFDSLGKAAIRALYSRNLAE